jgi:hypothetical protein
VSLGTHYDSGFIGESDVEVDGHSIEDKETPRGKQKEIKAQSIPSYERRIESHLREKEKEIQELKRLLSLKNDDPREEGLLLKKSDKVSLVPGYDVHATKAQIDEAVDTCNKFPTRLIRNLLMIFFKPEVLANSSAFGTRKFAALDKTILTACLCKFSNLNHIFVNNGAFVHCFFLEFAMSKYSSVLNDKSANFRRYQICKLPQNGLSLSCCSYVFIF